MRVSDTVDVRSFRQVVNYQDIACPHLLPARGIYASPANAYVLFVIDFERIPDLHMVFLRNSVSFRNHASGIQTVILLNAFPHDCSKDQYQD